MTLKIASIIASSLLISGCMNLRGNTSQEWPLPEHPKKYPVTFVKMNDGLFLSEKDSRNLMLNIDELDAYVLKLEKLVEAMKKNYDQ